MTIPEVDPNTDSTHTLSDTTAPAVTVKQTVANTEAEHSADSLAANDSSQTTLAENGIVKEQTPVGSHATPDEKASKETTKEDFQSDKPRDGNTHAEVVPPQEPSVSAAAANGASGAEPVVGSADVHQTLVLIKPDAMEDEKKNQIVQKFKDAGFAIVKERELHLSVDQAKSFYREHEEKDYFDKLVTFMSSRSIYAMVLEKEDAVEACRRLMGPTNSKKARRNDPQSIRALFGTDGWENAIHGSSSSANAEHEIEVIFGNNQSILAENEAPAAVVVDASPLQKDLTSAAETTPSQPSDMINDTANSNHSNPPFQSDALAVTSTEEPLKAGGLCGTGGSDEKPGDDYEDKIKELAADIETETAMAMETKTKTEKENSPMHKEENHEAVSKDAKDAKDTHPAVKNLVHRFENAGDPTEQLKKDPIPATAAAAAAESSQPAEIPKPASESVPSDEQKASTSVAETTDQQHNTQSNDTTESVKPADPVKPEHDNVVTDAGNDKHDAKSSTEMADTGASEKTTKDHIEPKKEDEADTSAENDASPKDSVEEVTASVSQHQVKEEEPKLETQVTPSPDEIKMDNSGHPAAAALTDTSPDSVAAEEKKEEHVPEAIKNDEKAAENQSDETKAAKTKADNVKPKSPSHSPLRRTAGAPSTVRKSPTTSSLAKKTPNGTSSSSAVKKEETKKSFTRTAADGAVKTRLTTATNGTATARSSIATKRPIASKPADESSSATKPATKAPRVPRVATLVKKPAVNKTEEKPAEEKPKRIKQVSSRLTAPTTASARKQATENSTADAAHARPVRTVKKTSGSPSSSAPALKRSSLVDGKPTTASSATKPAIPRTSRASATPGRPATTEKSKAVSETSPAKRVVRRIPATSGTSGPSGTTKASSTATNSSARSARVSPTSTTASKTGSSRVSPASSEGSSRLRKPSRIGVKTVEKKPTSTKPAATEAKEKVSAETPKQEGTESPVDPSAQPLQAPSETPSAESSAEPSIESSAEPSAEPSTAASTEERSEEEVDEPSDQSEQPGSIGSSTSNQRVSWTPVEEQVNHETTAENVNGYIQITEDNVGEQDAEVAAVTQLEVKGSNDSVGLQSTASMSSSRPHTPEVNQIRNKFETLTPDVHTETSQSSQRAASASKEIARSKSPNHVKDLISKFAG